MEEEEEVVVVVIQSLRPRSIRSSRLFASKWSASKQTTRTRISETNAPGTNGTADSGRRAARGRKSQTVGYTNKRPGQKEYRPKQMWQQNTRKGHSRKNERQVRRIRPIVVICDCPSQKIVGTDSAVPNSIVSSDGLEITQQTCGNPKYILLGSDSELANLAIRFRKSECLRRTSIFAEL